jgi:hypothetical protein
VSILDISKNSDPRLVELRSLLEHIKKLEAVAVVDRDVISGQLATLLRGLFYVHLYGALEYAVSLSVQVLLQEMSKTAVPFSQYEHLLHVVALDSDFQAIKDSSWDAKFSKRSGLLKKQVSSTACVLNDSLFSDRLQNVWFSTLNDVFEYLQIPGSPVPEPGMQGYIDEIVENRNAVAHGRSSPTTIGRLHTSADLDVRLKAIREVIDHIIISFDGYLESREFIAHAYRSAYLPAPVSSVVTSSAPTAAAGT